MSADDQNTSLGEKVLIETYWNVNLGYFTSQWFGNFVLIETYWNVNFVLLPQIHHARSGINRNILECK